MDMKVKLACELERGDIMRFNISYYEIVTVTVNSGVMGTTKSVRIHGIPAKNFGAKLSDSDLYISLPEMCKVDVLNKQT